MAPHKSSCLHVISCHRGRFVVVVQCWCLWWWGESYCHSKRGNGMETGYSRNDFQAEAKSQFRHQMRSRDLPACLSLNLLLKIKWHSSMCHLFNFSPFLRYSTGEWRTNGRTDTPSHIDQTHLISKPIALLGNDSFIFVLPQHTIKRRKTWRKS